MDRYAKLALAIKDLKDLGFQSLGEELEKKVTAAFKYTKLKSIPGLKKELALNFEKDLNAKADSLGLKYKHSWTELTKDILKEWLDYESVPMRKALWEGIDLGYRPNSDGSFQLGFKASSAGDDRWMPLKTMIVSKEADVQNKLDDWNDTAEVFFKKTLGEIKEKIEKALESKAKPAEEQKPGE